MEVKDEFLNLGKVQASQWQPNQIFEDKWSGTQRLKVQYPK
jgi:hypothetical protein